MATPILYYWAPCATCAIVTDFATEHGIELDKRDVEQEAPYNELLALGGDANLIPYLYDDEKLYNGVEDVIAHLKETKATMSKYDKLWDYVAEQPGESLDLSFEEIGDIAGVPLDHSFLNYKKELLSRGWQVGKILMKKQVVHFERTKG